MIRLEIKDFEAWSRWDELEKRPKKYVEIEGKKYWKHGRYLLLDVDKLWYCDVCEEYRPHYEPYILTKGKLNNQQDRIRKFTYYDNWSFMGTPFFPNCDRCTCDRELVKRKNKN